MSLAQLPSTSPRSCITRPQSTIQTSCDDRPLMRVVLLVKPEEMVRSHNVLQEVALVDHMVFSVFCKQYRGAATPHSHTLTKGATVATNVVAEVRKLATASKASNHRLHGAVITPAQWATEAGFPGSKASPMRAHMARQSGNGVGRNGRYGIQDADGILRLLDLGDRFAKQETAAQKAATAKQTRVQLIKHRAKQAAKAKTVARKAARKSKEAEATQSKPVEVNAAA